MANKTNIGGDLNDPYYRYKRDIIKIKVIKNNSSKLENVDIIAKQLHCPSENIISFIKKQLGTNIKNDTINKVCKVEELETILNKFVKKYILCPICGLPELISISVRKCNACGYSNAEKKREDVKVAEAKITDQTMDKKISSLLNQLYVLREECKNDNERVKIMDNKIAKLWNLSEKYDKAIVNGDKSEFCIVVDKINLFEKEM